MTNSQDVIACRQHEAVLLHSGLAREELEAQRADLWERWAVLGGLVVAGVTAYWCGREHGGRRK